MKILGLDYGKKRIGVAVGDTLTKMAFPRDFVPFDDEVWHSLSSLCEDEHIEMIIVGMPFHDDGRPGELRSDILEFAARLSTLTGTAHEFADERYSSKISSQKFSDAKIRSKAQKKLIDGAAAQLVLQDWLEK